ncbi:hypothetical protein ADEAN_000235900 [Angomonas deanei]|uniref:Uncharacterized protein n=1 Tax=Angomonas deanei TaxID=59799 RepID=A0A7G2C596_9TRYP|nr:hypothetical protein ADEAN_000235900 [Angomonas deanei]
MDFPTPGSIFALPEDALWYVYRARNNNSAVSRTEYEKENTRLPALQKIDRIFNECRPKGFEEEGPPVEAFETVEERLCVTTAAAELQIRVLAKVVAARSPPPKKLYATSIHSLAKRCQLEPAAIELLQKRAEEGDNDEEVEPIEPEDASQFYESCRTFIGADESTQINDAISAFVQSEKETFQLVRKEDEEEGDVVEMNVKGSERFDFSNCDDLSNQKRFVCLCGFLEGFSTCTKALILPNTLLNSRGTRILLQLCEAYLTSVEYLDLSQNEDINDACKPDIIHYVTHHTRLYYFKLTNTSISFDVHEYVRLFTKRNRIAHLNSGSA